MENKKNLNRSRDSRDSRDSGKSGTEEQKPQSGAMPARTVGRGAMLMALAKQRREEKERLEALSRTEYETGAEETSRDSGSPQPDPTRRRHRSPGSKTESEMGGDPINPDFGIGEQPTSTASPVTASGGRGRAAMLRILMEKKKKEEAEKKAEMERLAAMSSSLETSKTKRSPVEKSQEEKTPAEEKPDVYVDPKILEQLSIKSKEKMQAGSQKPKEDPRSTIARPFQPTEAKTFRGSGGKPLNATANYLDLKLETGKGVFEYEVQFSPMLDSRNERFKIVGQLTDLVGTARVFNGFNLFLPQKLSQDETEVQVSADQKVRFLFKLERLSGDRETINIYNVLFGRIFQVLKLVQHKRSHFDPSMAHEIKQYHLTVWPGYITAVDRYEGGLLLQLDVAHRVLRTENVRDVMISIHKKGGNVKNETEKLLVGETILTTYNNKSYRIDEIDFNSKPSSSFVNSNGVSQTYQEYYKHQYGLDIKDPEQPLIVSRVKVRSQAEGKIEKMVCLIPELCLPTGLTEAMRADFRIMKEVGNFTRVSPENRQKSLMKFVEAVKKNSEAFQILQKWGLSLPNQTMPLEARVLQPETIHFGKGYREAVNAKADWGRAATTKHMLTPVPLHKWAVIFLDKNGQHVQNFCKIMCQQGPKMGMAIANPKVVSLPNDRTETYLTALKNLIDPSVQLVLTVFPAMRADRYSAIKKLCCLEKPIASQCINLKTINNDKKVTSVAQKVALQINCKLGGELWACATPFKNLMVVGIDVYHDKNMKAGSIAGIVASTNDTFSRYYSTVAIQQAGQELVDALKISFLECLGKYWEINHMWPDDVVVFRDGVGDGQLEVMRTHEVEQFISSFRAMRTSESNGNERFGDLQKKFGKSMPEDYDPGFYFLVVQKRINTRIFMKAPGNKFDNPPAGTILDHTVTRLNYEDFFLVPQTVNQGTVTPTHLIVLVRKPSKLKSKPLSVSDIQKLSFKLTHMYYNWPGTVRVPSPCQYANKLVSLVGESVHRAPAHELRDKLYFL